jgi:hypothetical protein
MRSPVKKPFVIVLSEKQMGARLDLSRLQLNI